MLIGRCRGYRSYPVIGARQYPHTEMRHDISGRAEIASPTTSVDTNILEAIDERVFLPFWL